MIIKGKAFAKINLFLHVENKLENGYHNLNSLVYFAKDIYDQITISRNNHFLIEVVSNKLNIHQEENLVYKAYKTLINHFDIPYHLKNIKIILEKKIPIAAGLGGGSADTALTLKLLSKLWNLDNSFILPLCKKLGADVPVCFLSNTAFVSGVGEKISTPVKLPNFFTLIVNPNKALLTKEVFEKNAIYNSNKIKTEDVYEKNSFINLLHNTSNTLEKSASEILLEIKKIKYIMLEQKGCIDSRMSGSGASIIGIFFDKTQAIAALSYFKQHHKNWWVKLSRNF